MCSPEKHQVKMFELKSDLDEIESDFVAQLAAIPSLNVEKEQNNREFADGVREARSYNLKTARLKQENVKLTAERVRLARKSEDIRNDLERARNEHIELEKASRKDEEEEVCKFEETLREWASRFRESGPFYKEEEMEIEMEPVTEQQIQQTEIEISELKRELSGLVNSVPENILSIVGQQELEKELQFLSDRCEALRSQHCIHPSGDQAGTSSTTPCNQTKI